MHYLLHLLGPFLGSLTMAFGDCRCGHSIAYHMPIFGCAKCDCDEFH